MAEVTRSGPRRSISSVSVSSTMAQPEATAPEAPSGLLPLSVANSYARQSDEGRPDSSIETFKFFFDHGAGCGPHAVYELAKALAMTDQAKRNLGVGDEADGIQRLNRFLYALTDVLGAERSRANRSTQEIETAV